VIGDQGQLRVHRIRHKFRRIGRFIENPGRHGQKGHVPFGRFLKIILGSGITGLRLLQQHVRKGLDVVKKLGFLHLFQRLIELDMVQVQQRIGGNEDGDFSFVQNLIR